MGSSLYSVYTSYLQQFIIYVYTKDIQIYYFPFKLKGLYLSFSEIIVTNNLQAVDRLLS